MLGLHTSSTSLYQSFVSLTAEVWPATAASTEGNNIHPESSLLPGDPRIFNDFAIRVQALVGLLQSLENGEGDAELVYASNVQQLLGKLPSEHVANYARFTRATKPGVPYNLVDFSDWLEEEVECSTMATKTRDNHTRHIVEWKPIKSSNPVGTVRHGTSHPQNQIQKPVIESATRPGQTCPFGGVAAHHFSVCPDLCQLSTDAARGWIQEKGVAGDVHGSTES